MSIRALITSFACTLAIGGPCLAVDYNTDVKPLLEKYCADCHNPDKKKGDLDLGPIVAEPDFAKDHEVWEKVLELTETREMPPEKKPQPDEDARQRLLEWIEEGMTKFAANEPQNPGRVTLRRLNKDEYRRTIFDLLGVQFNPEDFPTDEVGYGFNNIGDVLSLSPMLMEKYLTAAEEIVKKAIVAEPPKVPKQKFRGDRFDSPNEYNRPLENHAFGFYREGEATTSADFIREGEYAIRIRAFAELAGPEPPKLAVKLAGKEIAVLDVGTEKPKMYETRITAAAGRQQLTLEYLNNYNDSTSSDPNLRGDRNVFVDSVEIEGPFDGKPEPLVRQIDPSRFADSAGWQRIDGKRLGFSSEGTAKAEWDFPVKDEYLIRVRAHGDQAGPELPKLRVNLGDRELGVFEIAASGDKEDVRDVRVSVDAGKQTIGVSFINDYYEQSKNQDRNLIVHSVEVVGPINAAAPNLPPSHTRLITRMPAPGEERTVAREILGKFAKRAYRRQVSKTEVDKLVGFVDLALKNGGSFLEGVQAAVQAALCSSQFLYRWELDPQPAKPGDVRNLSDYEIASRLSYFLWASMPDDELFAIADRGELLKEGNLEKQVARMLEDWRARSLVENFGGQWLQLHNVYEVDPDPKRFPKFSPELREDMKREAYEFLAAIIKEDRSVLELIDARFTFVNERLARHYDIDGVKGNDFRRVELPPDSPRGGVLTMGSVLLATSMPTRTSPVIRGKWILEQILGTPPPPPPPNVPPLDAKNIDQNLPLKQRLAIHRENPDCAGCHAKIDPLGFALENFDGIGAFRTQDGNNPVDAAGTLPNGTEINGAADLKRVIKGDRFVRNIAEKLLVYSLGRGLERYDKRSVESIMAKAKASDLRIGSLITAIVTSDPFLKRKTAEPHLASQ
jgi:hypothetical protein